MTRRSRGVCRIGTSGWHYPHWRGAFYPKDTPQCNYLRHYAGVFSTVEINNSFYRLPSEQTLRDWADATPPGLIFACKASRYITHMKKLKDPEVSLSSFLDRMAVLGDKLGPVLFQLPPHWRPDARRLEAFLEALPTDRRFTFEFRDPRWNESDILRLLERHRSAYCCFDLGGTPSPIRITADFAYVRLHGPGAPYRGSYSNSRLAEWAARITGWRTGGLDVYCYFDNDERAYAPSNAQSLNKMLHDLPAGDAGCGHRRLERT